ncbi:MAG TPA: hypothetical protein VIC33_01235 [Vicinamibacterales bacterium]|jgi:Skp family chaperone for outer membrane proteins
MDPQDVLAMADERFEARLAHEAGAIRLEIAGVRRDIANETAALRQEIVKESAALRHELAKESAALRQELAKESAALRQEIATVRQEMVTRAEFDTAMAHVGRQFDELKSRMADWRTDIIKWSFLFWTGQVLTTIGFLLVILRTR